MRASTFKKTRPPATKFPHALDLQLRVRARTRGADVQLPFPDKDDKDTTSAPTARTVGTAIAK